MERKKERNHSSLWRVERKFLLNVAPVCKLFIFYALSLCFMYIKRLRKHKSWERWCRYKRLFQSKHKLTHLLCLKQKKTNLNGKVDVYTFLVHFVSFHSQWFRFLCSLSMLCFLSAFEILLPPRVISMLLQGLLYERLTWHLTWVEVAW